MTRPLLAALAFALPAAAASAADADLVKTAAARGADYLRRAYNKEDGVQNDIFKGGGAAMAGWAILEAGGEPTEPAIRNIAAYLRKIGPGEHQTHHIAAIIFFFDRLDERTRSPDHRPLIQLLGVRLYAGMTLSGSWEKHCCDPLPPEETAKWVKTFETPYKPAAGAGPLHPEVAKFFAEQMELVKARGRRNGIDDNSCTHLGMLGLWAACRHGVPGRDAFPHIERRFVITWKNDPAGWSLTYDRNATVPMTGVGLIALALGQAARSVDAKPKPAAPAAPASKPDDPFFKPKKPAEVKRPVPPSVAPNLVNLGSNRIGQAMAALDADAPQPAGKAYSLDFLQPIAGEGNAFCTLWIIQRVGSSYQQDKIAGIDWFDWGCRHLLKLQGADGGWVGPPYPTDVSTSFAVLFLVKASPDREMTDRLAGRDPATQELRGDREIAPATPAAGGGQAETDAGAILAAKGTEFTKKVEEARDGKGPHFTQVLAIVARKADADRRKVARDALADRLTRMTAKTLKDMLADGDPEIRRAACLACAMKELDESVPWLIDRITDPAEAVGRAAHAALKSLTNVNHGPAADADEAAKKKAQAAWREWHAKRGK